MAGTTRIVTIAEGVTVTGPSQNFLQTSSFVTYASIAAYLTAKGSAASEGDTFFNSTDKLIYEYDGTNWQTFNTVKNNYVATTNPAATDDSGDGYQVGSVWVNLSTDRFFAATDVTVGAAVWLEVGAPFVGINEFPSGPINGSNKDFTLNYSLISGTLHILLNGIDLPSDAWSLAYPIITLVDAPIAGQVVEAKYLSSGTGSTLVIGGVERKVETHLTTAGEITAKKIVLQQTPAVATEVTVNVRNGVPQAYGYDFNIINGNELNWNGLGLDGVIVAGTVLIIEYYF